MAVQRGRTPELLPREPPDRPPPLAAAESFDDGEDFEDASEEQPEMDLATSFQDCELAITKFFNNDIAGAMAIMKPWANTSLYHSLGASIFDFIPAILTFDPKMIARAQGTIKTCIRLCTSHRRNLTFRESLGTIIKRPNFSQYTDLEAHAELVYAEALLLQAALTVMEGEDLTGLIRATLKVKSCYSHYKDCVRILDAKIWDTETSRLHFESGARFGMATFSLMISLLPPRLISILEFVGFTGNKDVGLAELLQGSRSPGMRSVLCDLTLLTYNLIICQFIGAQGDLDVCEEILHKELQVYPEGVWFLIFQGRQQLLRGMLRDSINTYTRALFNPTPWPQFRHLCFWELMWLHALRLDWRAAASYADRLISESTWSKTIYYYTKAAWLLMLEDLTYVEKLEITILLDNAPMHRQRIAGKSLPMEKFVIRRCERFKAQGGKLLLPGLELLCLWNLFPVLVLGGRGHRVHKKIERVRDDLECSLTDWGYEYRGDNGVLVRYLQGSLFAAMQLTRMAVDTLKTVLQYKHEIQEDHFLIPYAMVELAMCHHKLGDSDRALQMLQDARKKHSSYSLESRLHFKLHAKMAQVKAVVDGREDPQEPAM